MALVAVVQSERHGSVSRHWISVLSSRDRAGNTKRLIMHASPNCFWN